MTETAAAPAAAAAWATTYTVAALAALPADITTATPAQVDEVIRTVQLDAARQEQIVDAQVEKLHKAMGETQYQTDRVIDRDYRGRPRYAKAWPTTTFELFTAARALPADAPVKGYVYGVDTIGEILALIDAAVDAIDEAKAIEKAGRAEYARRGGWARYYKVDNSNGHVHTDTTCRTTYASTAWCWPTQLSGADAATVVEAAGSLTCLVCFPDEREEILAQRPVRFDAFETPEQRDERVAREEAAAARTAAKIAKGVTPDGKPLNIGKVDRLTVEIKTERAAELRYVEFAADAAFHAHMAENRRDVERADWDRAKATDFAAGAARIVPALAWKRGLTEAELVESLAKKVTKKANARILRGW